MSEVEESGRDALTGLPENAQESMVGTMFIPPLFKALGYNQLEIFPQYNTGNGSVDFALRHNQAGDDIFLQTATNPNVLVEIKGRDYSLDEESTRYKSTVKQLKRYLLSPECTNTQWGIITNSCHIQMFRKHGKVIHPVTQCLEIKVTNIDDIIKTIKQKIYSPFTALTVAIYNNKGGVGKTTTTVNLAAILTILDKRVLVVDFDPNQRDLTNYLNVSPNKTFYSLLDDINEVVNIRDVIRPYAVKSGNSKQRLVFDVIPCDEGLGSKSDSELEQLFKTARLKEILNRVKYDYDYILIDSPPNWRFFSASAVYAADVVLIPTKHNNPFSLVNAGITIKSHIPQVQAVKKDGTPIALPIFWNGERITDPARQVAHKLMDEIIKQSHKTIDLFPYFYPRHTSTNKDKYVFELPSYADIAKYTFDKVPAVYKDKTAREYYLSLAKEYFLQ